MPNAPNLSRQIVPEAASPSQGTGPDWKILLIDDEPDIREIMHLSLMDAGHDVICAEDGIQGLELLGLHTPQILITDIKMPGIDGLEVLKRAKALAPEIEVIVTTGFADINKATVALQNDASDFITKPVDDERLHLALDRAFKRFLDRKALDDYTVLLESENLKTSTELIQKVDFQRRLIENSMDGILGCDGQDRVVIYNKAMEDLLGYARHEVFKVRGLSDFFDHKDFLALKHNLVRQGYGGPDRLFLYETVMKGKQRERLPVQVSGSLVIQEDASRGLVLFIRNLARIRALEQTIQGHEKILHQEKMMSLGRLAASIVHEINNPLSGILNYIRLMIRLTGEGQVTPAMTDRFRDYLDIVDKETFRCSQLVSGLLKFSRKSKVEFAPVDVGELVRYSLMLCNHKLELSNIRVKTAASPDLPQVSGDFNQLQQCLINLIFNALDAMAGKKGGIGDGSTGKPQAGTLRVDIQYTPKDKWVSIQVRDTGRGIARADLPYIFEPFFTTKEAGYGVGLGLSTAFGIVERHGGRIDVQSREGKGSCFIINLPPAGSDALAAQDPAAKNKRWEDIHD